MMKIRLSTLRRTIREAIERIEASQSELEHMIAALDPKEVAAADYVDAETGEVYLQAGDAAGSSALHPASAERAAVSRTNAAAERARYDKVRLAAEESEEAADEADRAQAEQMLSDAIEGFAKDWGSDAGPATDEELQSRAQEMAEEFFYEVHRWRTWARMLRLSQADIRSWVADEVYERMREANEVTW